MSSGLAAASARADVGFSYSTDASAYTGSAGGTVTVDIYLKETLTGSSTDLITPVGGLIGAGAAVNVAGTTGGTAATIAQGTYAAASPFSIPANSVYYNQGTGNNLEFAEITAPGVEAFPTAVATGDVLLLGTLTVRVGTGTTTYALSSLNNDTINGSSSNLGQEDGNTLTLKPQGPGTDLDATGDSAFTGADAEPDFTFTVGPTATPEPTSLLLLGVAAAPFALASRRRHAAGSAAIA